MTRSGSPTSWAIAALHTAASIGVALVRLNGGDPEARSDLFAARDAGLRLRIDELVTVPMSNLAHHEVEQGRFAQADDILADALRFSEERDIPICSMWQRGVQARLRLFQGRWREAEEDALAVLAAGDVPMGRLWSHLVLGLLAARRDAPAENPHLDELWRLATKLDLPGVLAPAAAALAEQAWITRRADPRLDHRSWRCSPTLPGPSGDQLRRWVRRLGAAGVQPVDDHHRPAATASARAAPDSGTALRAGARPVGRRVHGRPACRAPSARRAGRPRRRRASCAGGCASSAWPAYRAAAPRSPGPTRAVSPTASSTCWPCSSRA